MKLTQILMCALAMGAVTFATNVYAVPGPVTVSGTALVQTNNAHGYDAVKQIKFNQKILLQVLAQATGDSNITNHKTTVYYDPGAENYTAYYSNEGVYNSGSLPFFYGEFFYSNSVTGPDVVYLDGTTGDNDYYSYIEFDYYNRLNDDIEGFWTGDTGAYNNIIAASSNKKTVNGNGLLYIHSNPSYYDLPAGNYYFANRWDGFNQQYAFVISGPLKYGGSLSGSTLRTTGALSGSGDGLYQGRPVVVSGKSSFSAKENND
jgi:hypothetical protein